jgi:hypothetical protein
MWGKRIVEWVEDGIAFLSIVFTWQLPQAYSRCIWYKQQGYRVKVGGTAVMLMPDYLKDVAEIGGNVNVLWRHNPDATRTTLGCPRRCSFCGVRFIEPEYIELREWERKPIVCDNNLTAASKAHFDKVIDSLKGVVGIDINQGLDARLLTKYHVERLRELDIKKIRIAWDDIKLERHVLSAIQLLQDAGFPKANIGVYVLFNYKDTPEDALYRCETLKLLNILPNVQRYQPLDSLIKNSYVSPNWNAKLLADFTRYWSRQIYLRPIPFSEYKRQRKGIPQSHSQSVMRLEV